MSINIKSIFPLLLLLCAFSPGVPSASKTDAQAAFELVNKIRANPSAWSQTMGVDLSQVKAMPLLKWNDTLAAAAETKAMDMAKRNYFGHINPDGNGMNFYISQSGYSLNKAWLKNNSNNYFESIQAGASTGEEAIQFLIVDNGIPSLGHRKHLLGMDDWNATLTDIGVGFVRSGEGATYKTYTCILIAKHNW